MGGDSPFFPEVKPGLLLGFDERCELGRWTSWGTGPECSTLGDGDEQEEGEVEQTDTRDVDFVEPSRRGEEFQRYEDEDGDEVKWWLIGENGIAFDTLKGKYGPAELNLGWGVGDDGAKCGREHRYEDGEEEGVAQESESYHKSWSQYLVKLNLVCC